MSTNRRTFLKLMGLGAGVLVTPKVVLGSSVGQPQTALWTPSLGLAQHWVGYPHRELGCGFGFRAYRAREYVIRPQFERGVSPQEVFFKASLELQKRLGEETLKCATGESSLEHLGKMWVEEFRGHYTRPVEYQTVVTSVMAPIYARSIEGPGFEVVADCTIEVLNSWDPPESTWSPPDMDVYSPNGEYPVELPSHFDMNHMMMTAEAWHKQDDGLLRRLAHIKTTFL